MLEMIARPAKRMGLSSISNAEDVIFRILIYGVPGVGKSSWAKGAPKPIWIPVEKPKIKLDAAFPQPKTLEHVYEALDTLEKEPHDFKTVVLDSVDALEWLVWQRVTQGKMTLEAVGGGFGKGYNIALEEWRKLVAALEHLIEARAMNVILIGHAVVKSFENPGGENFDRYTMKLFETKQAKPGALLCGWCDAVLFANYEFFTVRNDGEKKAKGVGEGSRLLHTEWRPAFDAKNRFNLPPVLPLCWEDFAAAMEAKAPESAIQLKLEISVLAEQGVAEIKKKAEELVKASKDDPATLAKILDRLKAKLAQGLGAAR